MMDWHKILVLCTLLSFTSAQRTSSTTFKPGRPGSIASQSPGSLGGQPIATSTPAPGSCSADDQGCCAPGGSIVFTAEGDLPTCTSFKGSMTLTGFSATTPLPIAISTIDGDLEIAGLTNSGKSVALDMSNLTTVNGNITFVDMPALQIPHFPSLTTVGLFIFDNVNFTDVARATSTGGITFSKANAKRRLRFQGLTFLHTNIHEVGPFLRSKDNWQLNLNIQDNGQCRSVSMPDADNTGLVIVRDNPALAILNLTNVEEMNSPVSISHNNRLASLDFPKLQTVLEPVIISDNGELTKISLGSLSSVADTTVHIEGPINSLTLTNFTGADSSGRKAIFIDVTGSGTFDCSRLSNIEQVSCTSASSPSSPISSANPSATSSEGSNASHDQSSLSSAATVGVGVGVGIGGALILAFGLFLCWRRRSRSSASPRSVSKERPDYSDRGDYYGYREVPYEIGGAKGPRVRQRSVIDSPTSMSRTSDAPGSSQPTVATMQDRSELEEQQGQRHEMDARSIDFGNDDDEAETRSLEDIERVHHERR